jgi:hypothetical protein
MCWRKKICFFAVHFISLQHQIKDMKSTNIRNLLISIIQKVDFFQTKRKILTIVECDGPQIFSVSCIEDGLVVGNWLHDGQTGDEATLPAQQFDLDVLLLLYTEGVHLTTSEDLLTKKEQEKVNLLNKILCD